jgi:hypothetical protein
VPLLIDTYNVLHTTGILPPELAVGDDVLELVRLLQNSRYRDERITLACDGVPPAPAPAPALPKAADPRLVQRVGGTTIRYSGHGRPADDLIAQLIQASTAPRLLIVVSSDHQVLKAGRRRKCRLLSSEEFLQQLADDNRIQPSTGTASPAKPKAGMSQEQIDRWLKLFNIDEQTIAITSGGGRGQRPTSSSSSSSSSSSDEPQPPNAEADEAANAERQIPELAPGQELPPDVLEQAERLWAQGEREGTTDEHR